MQIDFCIMGCTEVNCYQTRHKRIIMNKKMSLIHPGEILKMELFEGRRLTVEQARVLLGITGAELTAILDGKAPITPGISSRIVTAIGGSMNLWIRLQSSYDYYRSSFQ
jgi:addiction module HigA family antidote